jgi:hypothetical protein
MVSQAVDLDPELLRAAERAQLAQRLVDELALLDDDAGLLDGLRRGPLDVVEQERVGRLLDEVEDVVEAADERVDVLAVEGRDEGRVQALPDGVAHLVAVVLHGHELPGQPLGLIEGAQHLLRDAGAPQDVGGVLANRSKKRSSRGMRRRRARRQG